MTLFSLNAPAVPSSPVPPQVELAIGILLCIVAPAVATFMIRRRRRLRAAAADGTVVGVPASFGAGTRAAAAGGTPRWQRFSDLRPAEASPPASPVVRAEDGDARA